MEHSPVLGRQEKIRLWQSCANSPLSLLPSPKASFSISNSSCYSWVGSAVIK